QACWQRVRLFLINRLQTESGVPEGRAEQEALSRAGGNVETEVERARGHRERGLVGAGTTAALRLADVLVRDPGRHPRPERGGVRCRQYRGPRIDGADWIAEFVRGALVTEVEQERRRPQYAGATQGIREVESVAGQEGIRRVI